MFDLQAFEAQSQLPKRYAEMTNAELEACIIEGKKKLGKDLYLPCHHYQRDEVVQFADSIGDSLQLARYASETDARYIIFCGVHFMAETADMLTTPEQEVYLPDMRAGCSMADMANGLQTERGFAHLTSFYGEAPIPITYVNSTAEIKAFVGRHGGATVTSSNAHAVVKWALDQGKRLLFLPDQHLGRNTAYDLGIPLSEMCVWNPIDEQIEGCDHPETARVILWKGHCSVHEHFNVTQIEQIRKTQPDMHVIVHPECAWDVVQSSDSNGSTQKIIATIESAPAGSKFAIGTEMNLVARLIKEHPDKEIVSLNPYMCSCLTMNRIDLPHLAWMVDSLANGETPPNRIVVSETVAQEARQALSRMLTIV
ncbi:MAG: quinolinate synthase NadA [Bacilli bacterium]